MYEEEGPYPSRNPSLRSRYVSKETIGKAVEHFCPKHSDSERDHIETLIWEAYTDPEHFDEKHQEYVRSSASWLLRTEGDTQIYEARPFWSELTEYDDEGYFEYCTAFIIMNETKFGADEVDAYLEELKKNMNKEGGFFKKLFS